MDQEIKTGSRPEDTAVIEVADGAGRKTIELPVLSGTLGPNVIDIRKLYKEHGYFTYDPGFMSTASCDSQITYIDGAKGLLMHRGYDIQDLAEHSTYLDLCYLLFEGELPTREQHAQFRADVTNHTMLHEQMLYFYRGFRRDAHPMAITVSVVAALSAFYHDSLDINDPAQRRLASIRMIAKMPTIAANAYKYSIGQPFVYPKNSLGYAENFMHMMFSVPTEDYEINPVLADALDKIMILHADHEQNASTSTVRLASSSQANPFACIAAGVASLWGPAHGGANEAVLNMLHEIGHKDNIPRFIERAKDKNDPFRLMGFGHRVYKNFDPRAAVLKKSAKQVLQECGDANDPLLELAQELERVALEDPYFVERKLFPNVDFYSGIILKAMGIPVSMFTVLFALSRTVGWVAQWQEMSGDPRGKIGRPRQLYIGNQPRKYIPIDDRT